MEPPTGKSEICQSRMDVSKWNWLTVAKRDLLTKKTEHDLPFAIEKSDIVALVSTSWKKRIANKRTKRKAVSEQGW